MKLTPFLLVLAGSLLTAGAQTLDKGTREFAIAGNGDVVSGDVSLYVEPKYGYFVADNFEVGLSGSLNIIDDDYQLSIGPFAEYNFQTKTKFVPFLGLGVEWINADIDLDIGGGDVSSASDGVAFDASAGVKYFIAENIAISTRYTHAWASDDVFTSANEIKDSAGFYLIGMRFYF